jgi:hypothetical protein
MKKITKGEKLFYLIRDEVLEQIGQHNIKWSNIGTLFDDAAGNSEFVNYIKGATSIYIMRRLLRFWKNEHKLTADETQYVRKVSSFIKKEVFPTIDSALVGKIARSVIEAETASGKPISWKTASKFCHFYNKRAFKFSSS